MGGSAVLANPIAPPDNTDQLLATAQRLTAVDADGCLKYRRTDEIVVCGQPEIDREMRLPFPELAKTPGERERNPLPGGNPEIVQQGRCYVTVDERNCFKGVRLLTVGVGRGGAKLNGGTAVQLWQRVEAPMPTDKFAKAAVRKAEPE
jgi:hypothetical protein